MARKAQADMALERAALQLRHLFEEAARELREVAFATGYKAVQRALALDLFERDLGRLSSFWLDV
jgi:hypothetical protein